MMDNIVYHRVKSIKDKLNDNYAEIANAKMQLQRAIGILNTYPDREHCKYADMNYDDWNNVLSILEHVALNMRCSSLNIDNHSANDAIIDKDKALYNLPVNYQMKDGVIIITAPYTYPRYDVKFGALAQYLEFAIYKWCQNYDDYIVWHSMKLPIHVCVTKFVTKNINRRLRDNDNYEISKMINVIFDMLGYSDHSGNMDYTNITRLVEKQEDIGIEMRFISEYSPEKYKKNLETALRIF